MRPRDGVDHHFSSLAESCCDSCAAARSEICCCVVFVKYHVFYSIMSLERAFEQHELSCSPCSSAGTVARVSKTIGVGASLGKAFSQDKETSMAAYSD